MTNPNTNPTPPELTIIKLNYALTLSSIKRNIWQLIFGVIGMIFGAGVVIGSLVGSFFLGKLVARSGALGISLAQSGSTLACLYVSAFWIIFVVIFSPQGTSLKPAKFKVFGISHATLYRGITIASLLSVGAITTILAMMGMSLLWLSHPVAMIAALIGFFLSSVCCVLIARTLTQALDALVRGRTGRMILMIIEFLLFMALCMAPSFTSIGLANSFENAGGAHGGLALISHLNSFTNIAGFLPFSIGPAVAQDVISGAWGLLIIRVLISLATIAVCAWCGYQLINYEQNHPVSNTARAIKGLGAFAWCSDNVTGAILARIMTYFRRDPRYVMNVFSPILLIVIYTMLGLTVQSSRYLILITPIVIALIYVTTESNGLAYDGRAFAMHVVAGVPGIKDRIARVTTSLTVAVVLIIVSCIIAVFAMPGHGLALAVIAAVSCALSFAGFGVGEVASTYLMYPVASVDEPLKNPRGNSGARSFLPLLYMLISGVVALPTIGCAIAAAVMNSWMMAIITFVVAVVNGVLVLGLGLWLGGRSIDRRGPEILQSLNSIVLAHD